MCYGRLLALTTRIRKGKAMSRGWTTGLAVVALIVSVWTGWSVYHGDRASHREETVLERINRTSTMRCGYIVWPPYFSYDPGTKEMGGISYDYTMALAKELGVKVEWVEETGWGTFQEGLNANRFDILCTLPWISGGRSRIALLSRPVITQPMYAIARADDNRFPDEASINKPDVKIAVVDGDPTQEVRHVRFPKSQELPLSPMIDNASMVMNVTGRKADIAFYDGENVENFNRNATDKIKIVAGGSPVRLFNCAYAIKLGESDFKASLDAAIGSLMTSGIAAQVVADSHSNYRLPESP